MSGQKKRKRVPGTEPRYVNPVTQEQALQFMKRNSNLYTVKGAEIVQLKGEGCALSYPDISCFRDGHVATRYCTQGRPLMLLCRYEVLSYAAFQALPKEEQYLCVRSGKDYFHLFGDVHAVDEAGHDVLWAFPGNLVQLVEEVEEEDDHVRGNCCLVVTSDKDAAHWSDFMAERFGVEAECRLWLCSWRDIANGVTLTLDRQIPESEEEEAKRIAEENEDPWSEEAIARARAAKTKGSAAVVAAAAPEVAAAAPEVAAAAPVAVAAPAADPDVRAMMAMLQEQMRLIQERLG